MKIYSAGGVSREESGSETPPKKLKLRSPPANRASRRSSFEVQST